MWGRWWRKLLFILNRSQYERDLAEEMEAHLAHAGGATARARFGNPLRLREQSRETWGLLWLDNLGQDLRYALRTLRQSPVFTLTALAVLTLGIGVNVIVFTVFSAFVLRPLPVKDPDTLAKVSLQGPRSRSSGMPYPLFRWYRDQPTAAASVFARTRVEMTYGSDLKQKIDAELVTPDFFEELGAFPARGRLLQSQADAKGGEPVIVLSYGFWQRALGGDPGVVGQNIVVNRKSVRVIGVTPQGFTGLEPESADAWLPITLHPYLHEGSEFLTSMTNSYVDVYLRMVPGMTLEATEAAMKPLAQPAAQLWPSKDQEAQWFSLRPGAYLMQMRDKQRPLAFFVFCLVMLVLVAACANLGNLLLARSTVRSREIAIRLTLGASRGRIVRQFLTECLLLAFTGATLALVTAAAAAKALISYFGATVQVAIPVDWRVAVFTYCIAGIAALAFGLTPTLQATRRQVIQAIKQGGTNAAGSRGRTRLRSILLAAQVAASCVLLIMAGLLTRGVNRVLNLNLGFDYQSTALLAPALDVNGYQPAAARQFWQDLEPRVLGIPGVAATGLISVPPLGNENHRTRLADLPGLPIDLSHVSGNAFRALQIPILRGRTFNASDEFEGSRSVIISEALARRLWPNEDPIGKELNQPGTRPVVVGVAGSARLTSLRQFDNLEIYHPIKPGNLAHLFLIVRTNGDPAGVAQPLLAATLAVDSKLLPTAVLLRDQFRQSVRIAQRGATVVTLLGGLALSLATIGIWGLMSFAVSQRTKEIGLRMALGAEAQSVVRLIARQLWKPLLIGLVLGGAASAALSQVLQSYIYGLHHLDPLTYVGALALLTGTAIFSCLAPARRALSIDPAIALRTD